MSELPTGRGFADFVYIPKPEYRQDYPALVVELKWNKNAKSALQQIKEKNIRFPCWIIQVIFCWLESIMIKKIKSISV